MLAVPFYHESILLLCVVGVRCCISDNRFLGEEGRDRYPFSGRKTFLSFYLLSKSVKRVQNFPYYFVMSSGFFARLPSWHSLVAHDLRSRRRISRTRTRKVCSDDLSIIQRKPSKRIKLCDSSRVSHLNLLDYENKNEDFHSSFMGHVRIIGVSDYIKEGQEKQEKYLSASAFYFFVRYLKDISTNADNFLCLSERIVPVVKILKHCDFDELILAVHAVLDLFRQLQPHYSALVLTIFKHVCFLQELKTSALSNLFCFRNDMNTLRKVLDTAIENRFTFWTMWERNSCLTTVTHCPVTHAYFGGDFRLLKLLLDYGFHITHQREWTIRNYFRAFFEGAPVEFRMLKTLFLTNGPNCRSSAVDEVILFLSEGVPFESCKKRSFIIPPKVLIKCFQLIWSAREDPYVTKAELIEAYDFKFGKRPEMNESRVKFQKNINYYETVLADYEWKVMQPRSLQHLSRCTIRKTLNDHWNMPHGVAKLPVPERLKRYILLGSEQNTVS